MEPPNDENELLQFLRALNLQSFILRLEDAGVDGLNTLKSLTESEMERLGLKLGHIARIRRALPQWEQGNMDELPASRPGDLPSRPTSDAGSERPPEPRPVLSEQQSGLR